MRTLEQAEAECSLLNDEVRVLRAQLEWFKKQIYGVGKSEKLDRLQSELPLGFTRYYGHSLGVSNLDRINLFRSREDSYNQVMSVNSFGYRSSGYYQILMLWLHL